MKKEKYLLLDGNEQLYKHFYLADKASYDAEKYRYHNWQEFYSVYQENAIGKIELPPSPPSEMEGELSENSFYFPAGQDVNVFLNARYCPPFWHHLKFIKITYVLNGECFFYSGSGEKKLLKAGNFIIVPPDVEQTVFSCHDEDIVVNMVIRTSTFENTFSSLLTESEMLSQFFWKVLYGKDESSIVWFCCEQDEHLESLVLDMFEAAEKKMPNYNFFLISFCMAFLAYGLSHYQEKMVSLREERLKTDKFPVIIRYIWENYSTVTLASLAEHFHKSEGYLSRYIKRESGYPLTHIVKEIRLKKAALMLRDSSLSVEEIMLHVGYTDISYFYKAFKANYGMTPVTYRKQNNIITI